MPQLSPSGKGRSPQQPRRIPRGAKNPAAIHREFLHFWEERTELNEAIKALDFAHRLALHDIRLKPQIADRTLEEIYPASLIPPLFDVSLKDVERRLRVSEIVLTEAAFLLAQPVYEHYVEAFIHLVATVTGVKVTAAKGLAARHKWISKQGIPIQNTAPFELFDLLRLCRNALVHERGLIDDELAERRADLSARAEASWKRATKEALPKMLSGTTLALGSRAPIGMIYAVANLGAELNIELVSASLFNDKRWAEIVVFDYRKDARAEQRWRTSQWWKERLEMVRAHAEVNFQAALPQLISRPALLQAAVKTAPSSPSLPNP